MYTQYQYCSGSYSATPRGRCSPRCGATLTIPGLLIEQRYGKHLEDDGKRLRTLSHSCTLLPPTNLCLHSRSTKWHCATRAYTPVVCSDHNTSIMSSDSVGPCYRDFYRLRALRAAQRSNSTILEAGASQGHHQAD
jgi:hypothetical protein